MGANELCLSISKKLWTCNRYLGRYSHHKQILFEDKLFKTNDRTLKRKLTFPWRIYGNINQTIKGIVIIWGMFQTLPIYSKTYQLKSNHPFPFQLLPTDFNQILIFHYSEYSEFWWLETGVLRATQLQLAVCK